MDTNSRKSFVHPDPSPSKVHSIYSSDSYSSESEAGKPEQGQTERLSLVGRWADRSKTAEDKEYLTEAAEIFEGKKKKNKKNKYAASSDDDEKLEESYFFEAPNFRFIRTYEQYLDHYITPKDLYYFENQDIARTTITLGFRVPELYSRGQFNEVMSDVQQKKMEKRKDVVRVGFGIELSTVKCPLMVALIQCESENRNGKLACIIFIRTVNHKKQEVSGWIDYRYRLKTEDPNTLLEYFTCQKKICPRPSDLCYYNFNTFQIRHNSSEDYLVATDIKKGLQFQNKLDRKLLTVDPNHAPGDNSSVTYYRSPYYEDSAIYFHEIRFKG